MEYSSDDGIFSTYCGETFESYEIFKFYICLCILKEINERIMIKKMKIKQDDLKVNHIIY